MTDNDRLADANPVPTTDRGARVPPSAAHAESLFQEIIMTNPTSEPSTTRDFGPAPSRDEIAPRQAAKRRGFAITGVAAATAAAVGFGVVAFGPGSVPEAQAAMISAAENTEAARAGTAIITINADADGEQHAFVLTTSFDGSDLVATLESSDAGFDLGGTPEVRVVDGTIYLSLGDGTWYSIDDPKIADLLTTSGLPIDIRNDLSSGIVELVKSASNVEQVDAGHFRATVTVEEARRLASDFPSLGLFTDNALATGDLPPEVANQPLDIDLILDDNGLIDIVTIAADAIDPETGEVIDGSITIDLNDLGTGQNIEAPADVQSMDLESLLGGIDD